MSTETPSRLASARVPELRLIYLAGRYRSEQGMWGIRKNIEAAMDVGRKVWKMGGVPHVPHGNTAYMDGADIPDGVFLEGDLEIVRRCDAILMLKKWKQSAGARGEYHLAKELGLPVFHENKMQDLREWLKAQAKRK